MRFKIGLAVFLTLMLGCATSEMTRSDSEVDVARIEYPNPLAGPGGSHLERKAKKHLNAAWKLLKSRDFSGAHREALMAGEGPESALMNMQVALLEGPSIGVAGGLTQLTEEWPRYAAAWSTLSLVSESFGDENLSLASARTAEGLWPLAAREGRVELLEDRWIRQRIDRSEKELAMANFEEAFALADRALALEAENPDALLNLAKAQIGLQLESEAEATLGRLGHRPDALFLRAGIASNRNQWQQAMNLLSQLPEDDERRSHALRRARLRWRLSILPSYVQDAVASEDLTREQLAVVLVSLAPELETISGGKTPLMPDILNLESQRAILTVTRLGIMRPDAVEQRFLPVERAARQTVTDAVEAITHLCGYRPPLWCVPAEVLQSGCVPLSDPLSGAWLTKVILELREDEGA